MTESEQTGKDKTKEVKKPENKTQANAASQPQKPAGKNPTDKNRGGKKNSSGRSAVVFAVFALLIALASAAGSGALWYWGEMRMAGVGERVDTVERGLESNVQDVVLPKLQKLADTQGQLQQTAQKQQEIHGNFAQGLTRTRVQVGELTEKIEGGRRRWQLLEIEDLLLAANERLLLYKDAESAQQALSLASERLAQLNDPRLFKIRETVINEIAALNALPKPDIEGMVLALTSLIDQIPQLPLAKSVSGDYQSADPDKNFNLGEKPWQHFLDTMREALSTMVTLRRDNTEYKPLMPADQKFFLMQNLQLKLQSARLSLLQKDSQSYSAALTEAREWLQQYYDTNNSAVAGTVEAIGQMQKMELAWDVPDIAGSLEAIRSYLGANAGAQRKAQTENQAKSESKLPVAPETSEDSAAAAAGEQ